MSNQSIWEITFKQVIDLWITPEVSRRQKSGCIPCPYNLIAAQVIFYPDGRPNVIRLNEEVKFIGKVKFKDGVSKKKGDSIYAHEIENYEIDRLTDEEDPNCGHITLHRIGDVWSMSFDFIYNKGHAKEHLSAAREFLTAAQQSLIANSMRVFVDTCFSAAELAAKALIFATPLPGENIKVPHKRIHSRYNLEAKYGNIDIAHTKAFNRLASLRDSARYLNNAFNLDADEARLLIQAVENSISTVEGFYHIAKSNIPGRKRPKLE